MRKEFTQKERQAEDQLYRRVKREELLEEEKTRTKESN